MSQPLPPSLQLRTRRVDPYVTGLSVLVGIAATGFVLIALGKRSLARTLNVGLQLPGLVSGCIVGLALVTVGVGLIVVLHGRRNEAEVKLDTERVLDEAAALLAVMTLLRRDGNAR